MAARLSSSATNDESKKSSTLVTSVPSGRTREPLSCRAAFGEVPARRYTGMPRDVCPPEDRARLRAPGTAAASRGRPGSLLPHAAQGGHGADDGAPWLRGLPA